jgi:hypothetical protein
MFHLRQKDILICPIDMITSCSLGGDFSFEDPFLSPLLQTPSADPSMLFFVPQKRSRCC